MNDPARTVGLLRLPSRVPARRRLFCVPYAGGGAGVYSRWKPVIAEDIELVALTLPGRESRLRERPFDSLQEICEKALPVVAGASDLPYSLFGHSMGALVAYELAVALEKGGHRPPERLFVSARRSPDEPEVEPPVHGLPDARFMHELQHRYGAIPQQILAEPELLALLLPALRADIRAIELYAPTLGKVHCPIHAYGGSQDRHPRPDQLPGWQRMAERPVRVRVFEGDHFYLAARRDELVADICANFPEASG